MNWCFGNDFWVGVARNGCRHLIHENLKYAVSKEWNCKLGWFFAYWIRGSNFWLDRLHALYLWLQNASLLQLYLLEGSYERVLTGRAQWNRVSILPFCHLLEYFLQIGSLGFFEFRYGTRNPDLVLLERAGFFGKSFFPPQNWGNRPKIGFFEFKEKFDH